MKIWYQSSGALGTDPLWGRYSEVLKKNIQEVVHSDTTVHFYGVNRCIPGKDRFRSLEYLNTIQIIQNALKSEEGGYDAFVVGCTFDPGYREIKEILTIPVVFIGETAMHVASMIGGTFSIILNDFHAVSRIKTNIQCYGLERKAGPIAFFNHDAEEMAQSLEHPESILKDFQKIAEDLIDQGAEVILPGCGVLNQLLIEAQLREINGIPILDTAGVTVKFAEMMVDLIKTKHYVYKKGKLDTKKLKEAIDLLNVIY